MKKEERGITLLSLIITIIVLVILAAIAINAAYSSGIIKYGEQGAKEYAKAAIEENKVIGETTAYIDSVANNIKKTLGILEEKPKEESQNYVKIGETYCNKPDLSGFNEEVTYFVTYDGTGEKRTKVELDENGDISNAPEGWYDYGEKKWANIVTTGGGSNTYWVWIPRYKYSINEEEKIVNVKFVDKENNCTEEKDGEKQTVDVTEYKLPESFTFAGEELEGYWISKYKVQEFADGVGYQANKEGTSLDNTTANDFFEGIRKMETTGGTLGTNAVIDINGGTYKDSSANGIDCHMALNTEWGTVGMLAESVFGNSPDSSGDSTTTGNDSGVFQMFDATKGEYVAGMCDASNENLSKIFSADVRYRNNYTQQEAKSGDATTEMKKWQGVFTIANFPVADAPILARGILGPYSYIPTDGAQNEYYGSRAVCVCGNKL